MHENRRRCGANGNVASLVRQQRQVADPESGIGPVYGQFLAVGPGNADIERTLDQSVDAFGSIAITRAILRSASLTPDDRSLSQPRSRSRDHAADRLGAGGNSCDVAGRFMRHGLARRDNVEEGA